ncbi:MAG TPA: hypothetical protein VEY68_03800 [Anoxybacillus sp.]|nr:hypothetical protein [Anoxybacillus sp.]
MPRKKGKNRKRFWLIFSSVLVFLLIAGYGVYQYALNRVAEKITEEITSDKQLMEQINKEVGDIENLDEKLQEEIKKELSEQQKAGNSSAQNDTSSPQTSSSDSGKKESSHHSNGNTQQTEKGKANISFSSKQEALSFVMSRLSVSEMNRFRQMASDGLTEEEKQELKRVAFSRFSSAEIAAVLKALQ